MSADEKSISDAIGKEPWSEAEVRQAVTVNTPGTLRRVPNQPKTPLRSIRVPDELWAAAQAAAKERGEDVSSVIRAALERYVKRSGTRTPPPTS